MDEDFWRRLARNLAVARKRAATLSALTPIFGFLGILFLMVGAVKFMHTQQVAWAYFGGAAICVGLLILVQWYEEQP